MLAWCCPPQVQHRNRSSDDEEEEKMPIVEQPGIVRHSSELVLTSNSSSATGRSVSNEADDMTRGKRLFNVNPDKGIRFLQERGLLGTTPEMVSTFLSDSLFLDKGKIGEYISNPTEFSAAVLQCYANSHNFVEMPFDQALRKFLETFRLPGEAQKIDRIMEKFARTYCAANPTVFANPDTAYVLAFSLIMLNTDLHNPNIKTRMTVDAFIKNNRGINNGEDLPKSMLVDLYNSFKRNELQMDEGITYVDSAYTFFNPEREGYLDKLSSKMRGWNRRFFVITGNCLYYFKNEEDKNPAGIIPLEDLSVREVDLSGAFDFDTSPKFCFELYDANKEGNPKATIKAVKKAGGTFSQASHQSYIFAAETADERADWIKGIRANMAPPPIFSLMDARRKLVTKASNSNPPSKQASTTALVLPMDNAEPSMSNDISTVPLNAPERAASPVSNKSTAELSNNSSSSKSFNAQSFAPPPLQLSSSRSSPTISDLSTLRSVGAPPSSATPRIRQGHSRSTSDTSTIATALAQQQQQANSLSTAVASLSAEELTRTSPSKLSSVAQLDLDQVQHRRSSSDNIVASPSSRLSAPSNIRALSFTGPNRTLSMASSSSVSPHVPSPLMNSFNEGITTSGSTQNINNEVLANVLAQSVASFHSSDEVNNMQESAQESSPGNVNFAFENDHTTNLLSAPSN